MSGQKWYPHYAADFLRGVQGIGPDVIGAYIVVLDLIYSHGGPIRNDPRFIGGLMGCSTRLAAALIQRLINAGKLVKEGDFLTNPRASEVLEKASKIKRELREAGAKGGRTRAEKEAEARKNKDIDQARLKHITGHNSIEEEVENNIALQSPDSASERASDESAKPGSEISAGSLVHGGKPGLTGIAAQAARLTGVTLVQPGHLASAALLIREWIEAGADPPLIFDTLRLRMAQQPPAQAIHSLRYFDQSVRTEIARRKASLDGNQTSPAGYHGKPQPPVDEVTAGALARIEARRRAAAGAPD